MNWVRRHPRASLLAVLVLCGAVVASRASAPGREPVLHWDVVEAPRDIEAERIDRLVRTLERLQQRQGR